MGAGLSFCDTTTTPVGDPLFSSLPQIPSKDFEEKKKDDSSLNLPFPTRYEELQREVYIALHPELFEGLRFEFVKSLNEQFALTHSIFMGNMELPTHGGMVYKCPLSTYEFGANAITKKLLMVGRITAEGKLTGRIKYDLNDFLTLKWQAQLSGEPETSQQLVDIDLKGSDWNGQLKVGNGGFYGLNYFQSVTQSLSLGGEIFYLDEQRKSGLGFAGRYSGEKRILTGQISTTGMYQFSCLQKIDEKVSMAADFMYNANIREATTSLGYDLYSTKAHVRGKIDSNGVLSAYLEERLQPAITFLLSGSIDHWKKDYKFGFGLLLGE